MPNFRDDYDRPHYGEPRRRDYRTGNDAGYRGGGALGGDWPGGERLPEPYRGQSGPMWGPPDRDYPPSYRGRGPRNYQRPDTSIREDLCELLTLDDDIDATDIDVNVAAGIVTLNGEVPERQMKRRAERLAERIRGVRDVQNNLRLKS